MVTTTGVAPGFLLLPAREYSWEIDRQIEIRVPLQGKISELVEPEALAGSTPFSEEDEFCVFEDNLVLLWELVRVLFAESKYPKLEDDECLMVVALNFSENEVILHGEIIKSI